MICLITRNQDLLKELTVLFDASHIHYRVLDPESDLALSSLYAPGISGAVVDEHMPQLNDQAWFDLLGSLGRRLPVFILGKDHPHEHQHAFASRNSEVISWIDKPNASELLALLDACGATGRSERHVNRQRIPLFNQQVPLHMLQGNGALSILTINASSFRKISIEYGVDAYHKLQDTFHSILYSMWGQAGCFRKSDMLMRRSLHSNTYYVFLEQSRISHTVPAPGVLEKMADRLVLRLQQALWDEIFKGRAERKLPDCISLVPEFSVGHATALHNPCVDSVEVLDHLIESAHEVTKVQARRIKERQRELMQTLIQTKELLVPNFQAVFSMSGLTKELCDEVKTQSSIAPIKHLLHGFESLIRTRKDMVDAHVAGDQLVFMEAKLLRPDVMFALAAHSKVALELDQTCLHLGVVYGANLPGKLMVNLFPRNLIHIERLMHLISARGQIVFELSESEGVSNPQLMARIRDYVSKIDCSIAADDFGKGHASIERVIKLRPELIKLDRSLVEKINKDDAKRSFVEGIVKAAKIVKSLVLAEGIEQWEEAQTVQAMGVDLIQGFLLHRPQPVEEIQKQIEADSSSSDTLDSVA